MDGKEQNWLLIRKRDVDAPRSRSAGDELQPDARHAAERLPRGDAWLFEVKWDGYRALAYVRGGECRLASRNGNDLTARFPAVASGSSKALKTPNAVLDGEVCALDENGRPSFSLLQGGAGRLVYYVFDLLEADGERLVALPLAERQERLRALLDGRTKTVRISETFDDGEALLAAAEAQGLEGVMAKRADAPYRAGRRTREWLKVKTAGRQEFVVAGYTRGEGRRASTIGALVLAVNEGGALRWVGNAGSGLADGEIERLLKLLRPLERSTSPFPEPPKMPRVRKGDVVWVEPKLVAEIAFGEWTRDGRLRHPRYLGLREDKPAREVRRERPARRGRDPQGQARATAVEPRQALLAGRGDHEGRPARLLPAGRARARAAPAQPAVHDAPLPRRHRRQGVLPEGRAVAHAGLDPDVPCARLDRASRRRRSARSRSRS